MSCRSASAGPNRRGLCWIFKGCSGMEEQTKDKLESKREEGAGKLLLICSAFVTAVWFALLIWFVLATAPCDGKPAELWPIRNGAENYFSCRSSNELGDFFAGAFAPLAFLWLVVTVLLQSIELRLQRKELREARMAASSQADSSQKQVEFIATQVDTLRETEKTRAFEAAINALGFRIRVNRQAANFNCIGFSYIVNGDDADWRDFDDRLAYWLSEKLRSNIAHCQKNHKGQLVSLYHPEQFLIVFSAVKDAHQAAKNLNAIGTQRSKAMGIEQLFSDFSWLADESQEQLAKFREEL